MQRLQNNSHKENDITEREMIHDRRQNSVLRKHHRESYLSKVAKTISFLETLDDTDMFFLSMARMTKQLPKVEQAQIKLALSNSVLSSEVRCNQQSFSSNHYPQTFPQITLQQHSLISPLSSTPSCVPMTSPSDHSS